MQQCRASIVSCSSSTYLSGRLYLLAAPYSYQPANLPLLFSKLDFVRCLFFANGPTRRPDELLLWPRGHLWYKHQPLHIPCLFPPLEPRQFLTFLSPLAFRSPPLLRSKGTCRLQGPSPSRELPRAPTLAQDLFCGVFFFHASRVTVYIHKPPIFALRFAYLVPLARP